MTALGFLEENRQLTARLEELQNQEATKVHQFRHEITELRANTEQLEAQVTLLQEKVGCSVMGVRWRAIHAVGVYCR